MANAWLDYIVVGSWCGGVATILGVAWDRLTIKRGWRGWHIDD